MGHTALRAVLDNLATLRVKFVASLIRVPEYFHPLNISLLHKQVDILHRLAATGPGRSIFARRGPVHGPAVPPMH